ncbi:MAG: cysteine--tRNA ligase [Proteobacteria bacterium]|nr:cysteine--tRNA ligase [Pseudomonadota bacterium]
MREIRFTNTMTGKKEVFVPHVPGKVSFYSCGPTVYGFIHIGNLRGGLVADLTYRYLKRVGYDVNYVRNYTDVDDKIITKSHEEGSSPESVAKKYTLEAERDYAMAGMLEPTHKPCVTTHIAEIISLIQRIIDHGVAYVTPDGEVLFEINRFPGYGKLSGKRLDDLLVGARVAPDEKKRDPLDFSLWKPRKETSEPSWESPWGPGRPGWHIECSAMSVKYLGDTFDIHGGGMDLIHPHHENEIAQSEGASKKVFAKYWMHNNMLTVQSEKMSKSLGNIWLVREFINRFTAEVLKFFLLSGHYRSTLDFSERQVKEHQAAIHRIYTTLEKVSQLETLEIKGSSNPTIEEQNLSKAGTDFSQQWRAAMDDDFNTAKLFGLIFDYIRAVNAYIDKKGFKPSPHTHALMQRFTSELSQVSQVLNLFGENPTAFLKELRLLFLKERGLTEKEILDQIEQRIEARKSKNFQLADDIRSTLSAQGIELRDKVTGTDWDVSFTLGS